MVLMKKTISDFPIFIYNLLTYMGVSRTRLEKLPSGEIIISSTKGLQFFIYAIFHINSWCKGLFLVCLFAGVWNFEMEFFDYIAGLLWFLIFIEICIGDHLLMRKFPFFEVMKAGLKLQNEIHEKLGPRAEEFRQKQNLSAVKKVWFQWIIILMGIAACILQYASAPKYCIFTNALIEKDTPLINWVMGFHDVGFIVNAWMLYGSDIAIQSLFGAQLQHCLKFMADEVRYLTHELEETMAQSKKDFMLMQRSTAIVLPEESHKNENETEHNANEGQGQDKQKEKGINPHLDLDKGQNQISKRDEAVIALPQYYEAFPTTSTTALSQSAFLRLGHKKKPKTKTGDADFGIKFTIDDLIIDYRKLSLYAEQMNECCSYNFLTIHVIAYIQMTCDVFVIFQLLRTPGSEPSDVAYFIEDCVVCMYLLYKCFKAISFVGYASEDFLNALQHYTTVANPRRAYYRKMKQSLRIIDMQLGPSVCSPGTVGNASMILLNYYIMVALWK